MKTLALAVLALTTSNVFAAPSLKIIDDFSSAPMYIKAIAKPPILDGGASVDYQPLSYNTKTPAARGSRAILLRLGNTGAQVENQSVMKSNPQEYAYIGASKYKRGALMVVGDFLSLGASTQFEVNYVFEPQAVSASSYISLTYSSSDKLSGSFAFTIGRERDSNYSGVTYYFKGVAGEVKEMRIPISSFVSNDGRIKLPTLTTISSFTISSFINGRASIALLSVKIMSDNK